MLCVPKGTLLGVYHLITHKKHRSLYLSHVTDSVIADFWERFGDMKPQEQNLNTDSTLTRIFEVVSDPRMRNIVGQYKSSVNLRDIMSGSKVVLVSIPEAVLGRDLSRMLGCIVLCLIQLAAMERDAPVPFHVYLDQADRFAGSHLASMLDSIGDYGVSITLAHRYLGQFDPAFRDALLGSVGSLVCFQIGPTDAKNIKPMLALDRTDLYEELTDIPPCHAYGRTGGKAMLLEMPPLPEKVDPHRAKLIRRHCRTKYGRPREQVERDIAAFT